MRKIIILFVTLIGVLSSFAQTNNYWLQSAGSPNVDENLAIAKDNSNNIISAGYFTNTIIFPAGNSLTSTGSGTNDVLIQKTNASGQVTWAIKAGGMGSDRATAVACDASGNIYVTGYYYGTAQFGSFTLNSVNNTQDIFIAKLNSSGTFLWAKSAGGNLAETPYAIAVDNQSNVVITGEFQGTATFGTQAITSAVNPYTNNASFDVFTCKYDASGNFIWLQQGSAHFDDRGIDIGTDANGNVFVCGQFSDTITFNQTHNNQISNAVFLIKYNSSGQEQWFVKAGAINSIANGLVVDNNNDVYITGDYTGNLTFFGTALNNTLNGAFSNRVFLVKYSNAGNYIWGKEDASSSYVSSKDVALDQNNNPCIYGEFDCRMDDYSILAGGTGMFNSIGYHDLFITQYDNTGTRLWARNFGGPYNDYAHGIVFTNNSTPYVCGSFNYKLFVDVKYNLFSVISYLSSGNGSWVSNQNCNNNSTYYKNANAAGFTDCFILHGVDSTSAYYDYYYRSGGGCHKDFVGGCIDNYAYNCPDTIKYCGSGVITTNPYAGDIGNVGPFYHYQWNTGDTNQSHSVIASGNYACVMTTADGCFTSQDTVYVKINPLPQPPNITDNLGINVNQPPATHPIIVCGASTFTLTGSNLQGCAYQWTDPGGNGIVSTSGASCVVNQAGDYYFTLTNAYGCTSSNHILIQFQTLDHVVPKTNMPDTVSTCGCFKYFVYDSLSNPTGQPYSCFTSLNSVTSSTPLVAGSPQCAPYIDDLSLTICPQATGWINFTEKYVFSSQCGKDSVYFTHKVYVILNPPPSVHVVLTGNNFICPGDSTLLIATYTVSPSANITYTIVPNDSIWAHTGFYSVSVYATNTLTGCQNSGGSSIYVQTSPNPVISMLPANGIICPNDSVKLTCTYSNAVSWQWYGPSGILTPTTSVIYEHIPGFYYCVATNSSGCKLTSNTVEIKTYNTPYLAALPQNVVCAGQTVTLQVTSGDTTSIHWLPPLSGGGTIRVVSQSGTYSCSVNMCGIITICSMSVTVSQPVSHITIAGSPTICPGDSVLLTANTGMVSYEWSPSNIFNDSIYVYASGTYVLAATDANGCTALDSIKILYNPAPPPPPLTINDSICAGSLAHLQASTSGNYTIQWYTQPYSGSVINTGTSYTSPLLNQNTTYYVSVQDNTGCHSVRQAVNVFIKPTSVTPLISATNTSLCAGDTLFLHANNVAGAAYNWNGPDSFTSSQINPQINSATSAASGTYSLFISGGGCTSPVATITVMVTTVNIPVVAAANDSLCSGTALILQAQSSTSGANYSWTGPGNYTSSNQTNTILNTSNANTGTYYVQAVLGTCKSPVDSIKVYIKPLPNAAIHIKTTLCSGDSLVLYAQPTPTTATISWTGPAGFSSNSASPVIKPLTIANSGYYDCYCTLDGCTKKDSVKATVNALPPSMVSDTFICGSGVSINATYPKTIKYLWSDGSADSIHTISSTGTYWVTYTLSTSCIFTNTFHITIKEDQLTDTLPNIVTPNNDNKNDFIDFGKYNFSSMQVEIYNRWGNKIFESSDPHVIWRPECIDGTYFYIILYRIECGAENDLKTLRGFITVVR